MTARRRRTGASALLALAIVAPVVLSGVARVEPAGATTATLDTVIDSPAAKAVIPAGPVVVAGRSSAPAGVADVRVFVQDPVTRAWLHADGSWGGWAAIVVPVDSPGSSTSTWQVSLPTSAPGAVTVLAETRSLDGARDVTRAQVTVFLGTPPDTGVTTPASGAAGFAPLTVEGWATDDTGVSRVRLAVQDPASKLWWRGTGWGTFGWLEASVVGAGSPSASWSWTWTAAPAGRYTLFVEAIDNAGVPDDTRVVRALDVASPGPAFLTLMIGRSEWSAAEGCVTQPGMVTLDRVAAGLTARGRVATGGVVVATVPESTFGCQGGVMVRTPWTELAWLRDQHGWSFVPRSESSLSGLPAEQLMIETCGARTALEQHGHLRARGLFAYANNTIDEAVQSDPVSTCFAFGRRYGDGLTTRAGIGPPWWQRTRSFNGGACNDAALPCWSMPVANGRRYESPDLLAALLAPQAGQWRTVQLYRFVEGAGSFAGNQWDCTAADWRQHWTSRAELYCFGDYLSAVDRIPAGVVVTDPLTVAEAWGRG